MNVTRGIIMTIMAIGTLWVLRDVQVSDSLWSVLWANVWLTICCVMARFVLTSTNTNEGPAC